MYSMNYIGKFIAKFYSEINGATLTGAIDVVVVEQPDGSFTCSPFHVRFGKLGVLRSRFKVVDLELNGEPLNIHMKLGESGEAFFVEEVGEDEAECAAHLATSPIPATRFDNLYEPRRRNSLSAVEPDHGQASDYTKRRYTADGKSMQKPDLSKLGKNKKEDKKTVDDHDNEALFEMDGLNEGSSDWTDSKPKTFAATKLGSAESEANQTVQKISEHNDFRPIDAAPSHEDLKPNNGNGKKKKKTRKVSSKKKHQRKSSTSSISSQSDIPSSEQRGSQPTSIPNTTDINFYSDTEAVTGCLSKGSRHGTPVQSDTEMELQRAANGDKSSQSWRWGELPEPPIRNVQAECPETPVSPTSPTEPASPTEPLSSDEERTERRGVLSGMFRFMSTREAADTAPGGVYLDDLDRGQVDPDLYFPKHHADRYRTVGGNVGIPSGPTEEEYESGNGPSLPQSPNSPASLDAPTLDSDDDEKLLAKGQVSVMARDGAVSRALSYEEFCMQGAALASTGQLEVRLGTRCMPWRSAGPLLLSLLAYRRPLPNRVLEDLEKGEKGEESVSSRGADEAKPRSYSWWYWRRSNTDKRSESSQPKDEIQDVSAPHSDTAKSITPKTDSIDEDQLDHWTEEKGDKIEEAKEMTNLHEAIIVEEVMEIGETSPIIPTREVSVRHDQSSSDSEHETHNTRSSRRQSTFRKTLRLSSDQIKKLNLREGMNEMVFSVTTAYQGTTRCKCNVFRWRYDDKVVISDIDGTITKSDVLGHIFPLVGKDWAQSGVAQLFTKIKNNGYQLLYLSARAIGQARVTREYLRSIKQGEVCLPDGPLLLNPTSLLRAFHREVIEKKPEEFKIQCLADIKALFPTGSNPFYAGYGNRVNDVCAYQAVGIPIVRIFTINYKGELKHELTQTFQSTYSHMSVLVDQVFPPAQCEPSDEFSQSVYWREPLPCLELPARAPPAPH
ncbi:phosphatidate phosphatase LPIN3 isoform X2 [Pararge aegeria]|nr:phosphatidate phosphatase LPIN3 isoform X2 [Pararge aegeria]